MIEQDKIEGAIKGSKSTKTQEWCINEFIIYFTKNSENKFNLDEKKLGYYALKKLYQQKNELSKQTYFLELAKLFATIQTGTYNKDSSLNGQLNEIYYHLSNTLKSNVKNRKQAYINSTKESF